MAGSKMLHVAVVFLSTIIKIISTINRAVFGCLAVIHSIADDVLSQLERSVSPEDNQSRNDTAKTSQRTLATKPRRKVVGKKRLHARSTRRRYSLIIPPQLKNLETRISIPGVEKIATCDLKKAKKIVLSYEFTADSNANDDVTVIEVETTSLDSSIMSEGEFRVLPGVTLNAASKGTFRTDLECVSRKETESIGLKDGVTSSLDEKCEDIFERPIEALENLAMYQKDSIVKEEIFCTSDMTSETTGNILIMTNEGNYCTVNFGENTDALVMSREISDSISDIEFNMTSAESGVSLNKSVLHTAETISTGTQMIDSISVNSCKNIHVDTAESLTDNETFNSAQLEKYVGLAGNISKTHEVLTDLEMKNITVIKDEVPMHLCKDEDLIQLDVPIHVTEIEQTQEIKDVFLEDNKNLDAQDIKSELFIDTFVKTHETIESEDCPIDLSSENRGTDNVVDYEYVSQTIKKEIDNFSISTDPHAILVPLDLSDKSQKCVELLPTNDKKSEYVSCEKLDSTNAKPSRMSDNPSALSEFKRNEIGEITTYANYSFPETHGNDDYGRERIPMLTEFETDVCQQGVHKQIIVRNVHKSEPTSEFEFDSPNTDDRQRLVTGTEIKSSPQSVKIDSFERHSEDYTVVDERMLKSEGIMNVTRNREVSGSLENRRTDCTFEGHNVGKELVPKGSSNLKKNVKAMNDMVTECTRDELQKSILLNSLSIPGNLKLEVSIGPSMSGAEILKNLNIYKDSRAIEYGTGDWNSQDDGYLPECEFAPVDDNTETSDFSQFPKLLDPNKFDSDSMSEGEKAMQEALYEELSKTRVEFEKHVQLQETLINSMRSVMAEQPIDDSLKFETDVCESNLQQNTDPCSFKKPVPKRSYKKKSDVEGTTHAESKESKQDLKKEQNTSFKYTDIHTQNAKRIANVLGLKGAQSERYEESDVKVKKLMEEYISRDDNKEDELLMHWIERRKTELRRHYFEPMCTESHSESSPDSNTESSPALKTGKKGKKKKATDTAEIAQSLDDVFEKTLNYAWLENEKILTTRYVYHINTAENAGHEFDYKMATLRYLSKLLHESSFPGSHNANLTADIFATKYPESSNHILVQQKDGTFVVRTRDQPELDNNMIMKHDKEIRDAAAFNLLDSLTNPSEYRHSAYKSENLHTYCGDKAPDAHRGLMIQDSQGNMTHHYNKNLDEGSCVTKSQKSLKRSPRERKIEKQLDVPGTYEERSSNLQGQMQRKLTTLECSGQVSQAPNKREIGSLHHSEKVEPRKVLVMRNQDEGDRQSSFVPVREQSLLPEKESDDIRDIVPLPVSFRSILQEIQMEDVKSSNRHSSSVPVGEQKLFTGKDELQEIRNIPLPKSYDKSTPQEKLLVRDVKISDCQSSFVSDREQKLLPEKEESGDRNIPFTKSYVSSSTEDKLQIGDKSSDRQSSFVPVQEKKLFSEKDELDEIINIPLPKSYTPQEKLKIDDKTRDCQSLTVPVREQKLLPGKGELDKITNIPLQKSYKNPTQEKMQSEEVKSSSALTARSKNTSEVHAQTDVRCESELMHGNIDTKKVNLTSAYGSQYPTDSLQDSRIRRDSVIVKREQTVKDSRTSEQEVRVDASEIMRSQAEHFKSKTSLLVQNVHNMCNRVCGPGARETMPPSTGSPLLRNTNRGQHRSDARSYIGGYREPPGYESIHDMYDIEPSKRLDNSRLKQGATEGVALSSQLDLQERGESRIMKSTTIASSFQDVDQGEGFSDGQNSSVAKSNKPWKSKNKKKHRKH